jgi:hypothetical protein
MIERDLQTLDIRRRAHETLDEALDLYEGGAPLWIVTQLNWSTSKRADKLVIYIREDFYP